MTLGIIGIIGFGEAGGILAQDLAARGISVQVYDRLQDDPAGRAAITAKAMGPLRPSAPAMSFPVERPPRRSGL